jgi:hypothetical protein
MSLTCQSPALGGTLPTPAHLPAGYGSGSAPLAPVPRAANNACRRRPSRLRTAGRRSRAASSEASSIRGSLCGSTPASVPRLASRVGEAGVKSGFLTSRLSITAPRYELRLATAGTHIRRGRPLLNRGGEVQLLGGVVERLGVWGGWVFLIPGGELFDGEWSSDQEAL